MNDFLPECKNGKKWYKIFLQQFGLDKCLSIMKDKEVSKQIKWALENTYWRMVGGKDTKPANTGY